MTLGRSIALVQLVALIWGAPAAALAQGGGADVGFSGRQRLASLTPVRDARERLPVLQREISVNLRDTPLAEALRTIADEAGLSVTYSRNVVTSDWRVTIRARSTPVADILADAVQGSGMELLVSSNGQLVVVKGQAPKPAGSIEGTVMDDGTNQPLSDVYVLLEGTRVSAETGNDGVFRMADVPAGSYTLVARRIGYAPHRTAVTVADSQVVTVAIRLEQAVTRLTEVVTTATGEQRRVEVGNAIGRIQADSVALSAPVTNFADVLNARIPGVQVLPANGLAGQAPRIRVRGLSSATVTNDPIVIVDGIRFEQSPVPAGQFPQITSYGIPNGRMADLNPEDIESIEVIKGPSAATLYGTDAANGVIIIKTKRGQPGRTQWNVYAEQNMSTSNANWPDNYYAWGHLTATGDPTQCLLTQLAAGICAQDSITKTNPLMDPATSPIGTGYRQQVGLQVSGGSDALRYYVSGDYDRDLGVFRMPEAEVARVTQARGVAELPSEQLRPNQVHRGTLRANLFAKLSNTADVTLSTGFVRNGTRIPDNNGPLAAAWFGRGYRGAVDYFNPGFGGAPGDAFSKMSLETTNRFTTSLAANWRPASWLSTRAVVGGDFSNTFFEGLQRRGEGVSYLARFGGRLNQRTGVDLYTADLGATATFHLSPRLSSSTSVGGQYTRREFGQTSIDAMGLVVGSESATGATTITSTEQNLVTVVAGTYVQQTFGLNDRLFLTGAARADGASAFGANFKTSWYPKASATWVISDERFFGRPSWLDNLRFRAAYGASGVQPGPTAALVIASPISVQADGGVQNGATFTALGNPNLKPERQAEIEAGFDAELFGGRVQLEATYYNRKSTDALIDRPLGPSIGYGIRQENIGSVRNEGVEGLLSIRAIDGRRTSLDFSFNGSLNRNRLLQLAPGVTSLTMLQAESRVGYPLFAAWSRQLISYDDANDDGLIGSDEVVLSDEPVYLGPTTPTRQLTASTSLSLFRGTLRLSTMFDYRGGHVFRGVSDRNRCIFAPLNCRGINDPTTPLDEQANAVAASLIGFTYQDPQKADFVRWRELSAQLNLPTRWAAHFGARTASLVMGVRNLALFTGFPYVDPEIAGISGTDAPASFPVVPPVQTWIFRANFGF